MKAKLIVKLSKGASSELIPDLNYFSDCNVIIAEGNDGRTYKNNI